MTYSILDIHGEIIDKSGHLNGELSSVDYLYQHWDHQFPVDPLRIFFFLGGKLTQITSGNKDAYYLGTGASIFISESVLSVYPAWESRLIVARELQFFARRMNSLQLNRQSEEFLNMTKMAMKTLLPLKDLAKDLIGQPTIETLSIKYDCPISVLHDYINKYVSKGQLPKGL